MVDEDFIEVNVAASVPLDTTTVLHNFTDCDMQFHSLLKNGGGIQVTVTPSSGAATLVLSESGSIFGANLVDFIATAMYIVPKIHTSNRMPQVSSTDVELIIEHHSVQQSAGTRVFLCAVVSTDESVAPPDAGPTANETTTAVKIKGYDAGITAFLNSMDFSSYDPAQFKANNAKHLPTTATITFPGITECLAYQDSAQPHQNTVLLLPVPLIVDAPLLRSLNRMLTGDPAFTDFDLQPLQGGAVIRKQFQPNAPSVVDALMTVEGMSQRSKTHSQNKKKAEANAKERELRTKEKERDATFTLNVVSVLLVGIVFAIPIWIYGPKTYLFAVENTGGLDNSGSINMGILAVKCIFGLLYTASAVLVSVGSARRIWPMLIMGTLLAMYSTIFFLSVVYDINTTGTILIGLQNAPTNKELMSEVLRFKYQIPE